MPVYQELVNFDKLKRQLKKEPIILNDFNTTLEEDRKKIINLTMTEYNTDMLSVLPSCYCGNIKGEYAIGMTCNVCNGEVKSVIYEDIEPILWFRSPEGVNKLINPRIWLMLSKRFTKSGFNVLRWLCDSSYKPKVKEPKIMEKIRSLNIPIGYNYFVENFFDVLNVLFNIGGVTGFKLTKEIDYLWDLLINNQDCIFSDYLPLPNRSLFVIENTNVGIYRDKSDQLAINAIKIITSIDVSQTTITSKVKQNRTIKVIDELANFYYEYDRLKLATKTGIFRKHGYGTRTHFTFRCVVTSITEPHNYDEIYIPWVTALTVLRPHILNKLKKLGYGHNESLHLLNKHVESYNQLLDNILHELIEESPNKKIPVSLLRHPALLHGSCIAVGISRVKSYDITDKTISISILAIRSLNCDI